MDVNSRNANSQLGVVRAREQVCVHPCTVLGLGWTITEHKLSAGGPARPEPLKAQLSLLKLRKSLRDIGLKSQTREEEANWQEKISKNNLLKLKELLL